MDFKIIKNLGLDVRHVRAIDDDTLIITSRVNSLVDNFLINYYIYDLKTNKRKEILESIKKYDFFEIINMSSKKNIIYFSTRSNNNTQKEIITIMCYDILTDKVSNVYEYKDNLSLYEEEKEVKFFILNHKYMIIQHGYLKPSNSNEYGEISDFEIYLIDTTTNEEYEIIDNRFINKGIDSFYRIGDSLYAIKLGKSLKVNNSWQYYNESDMHSEYIAVFNIHQFVSDIITNQKKIYLDIIEKEKWAKTIGEMIFVDNYLIYNKTEYPSMKEEYVFYNIKDKSVLSWMDVDLEYKDAKNINQIIINHSPYILLKNDGINELIDLKNNNQIIVISNKGEFKEAFNDIMIFQKDKKGLFNRTPKTEVYFYPNFSPLLKEKGILSGCVNSGNNIVLIIK